MGVRREKRLSEGAEGSWDSSGEKSRKPRYCFLYCDYTDFVPHYCLPSLTRFLLFLLHPPRLFLFSFSCLSTSCPRQEDYMTRYGTELFIFKL